MYEYECTKSMLKYKYKYVFKAIPSQLYIIPYSTLNINTTLTKITQRP